MQDVTDAELTVLQVLWDEKFATVRQVTHKLYEGSAKSQHATVQKLLDRLKEKGFVARDSTVWPHLYRPAVTRDELISRRLQGTADIFCGGSMRPLITQLLHATKLTKADRQLIRKQLDNLDGE